MNFMKKIFIGDVDDKVHSRFIRFGKGEYRNRFLISLWKSKKLKVKSSFEFANDLVKVCAEFGNSKVSGIILSKKDISNIMSMNGIIGNSETKKGGLYYQNNIALQELTKDQILKLEDESYFTLLNMEGDGFKLKMKPKLPKPGKDEDKIDDKFCQLEADEKFYSKIREDFFWDLQNGKKVSVAHNLSITEIIAPKDEKDFAKIREMAKRKGKITRITNIDGKEVKTELDFEA
ncbi:hypothetical protein HYT24_02120 [Candidatus Pacearchaeota archaeon]|nr:hypothetical protein [Candidatus Pacearchaeota archaeon]